MHIPSDWQHLYDISPGFQFSYTYEGVIVAMNSNMSAQLGYLAEEVIGKIKFADILSAGGKVFYQTHFFPLVRLHGAYQEVFVSLLSKSGEEIPILINVKLEGVVPDALIHCAGLPISKRNMYERKILEAKKIAEKAQAENEVLINLQKEFENNQVILQRRLKQLAHQNNELQQLNSILSHEFQEPVRKIGVFSNLILEQMALNISGGWREHVKKIHRASESIRLMLHSAQKYLTVQEKNFNPGVMSLDKTVTLAVEQSGILSDESAQVIKGTLPEIYADKEMIFRLFLELFTNAMKFRDQTKSSLVVKISADTIEENIFTEIDGRYKYEEFVRIVVEDNGLGFLPRYNEEIFSLFKKAHIHDEGMGFGLAFCRKIVGLHHGRISATSEMGSGAKFTILLPHLQITHS